MDWIVQNWDCFQIGFIKFENILTKEFVVWKRTFINVLKQKFNAYERNGNVNFVKYILFILNWIKELLFILGKNSFFRLGYEIHEQRLLIEKAFEVTNILSIKDYGG
jgi:hypothetical protein